MNARVEFRELKIVSLGVILSLLYWAIESANDAVLSHSTFLRELWPERPSEFLLRILVLLFITGFGVYAGCAEKHVRHVRREKRKLIKALSVLVPICANCKSIRQEDEQWMAIENFVQSRTGDQFTHTICPECRIKLYSPTTAQPLRHTEHVMMKSSHPTD